VFPVPRHFCSPPRELPLGALYTLDAVTGAILYTTTLSAEAYNEIYNPEVNDAGQIVVLRLLGTSVDTATLDPMTGAFTDLAPTPHSSGYGDAMRAFDPVTNRIYQLGDGFILTVDGDSGAVLADTPLTDKSFINPQVNDAGEILGEHGGGDDFHMARLDPATGVVMKLAPAAEGDDRDRRRCEEGPALHERAHRRVLRRELRELSRAERADSHRPAELTHDDAPVTSSHA
jgi:hypothetical protein